MFSSKRISRSELWLQNLQNKNTTKGDKSSKLNLKRQMPLKETSFQKDYYYFSKRNEEEMQTPSGYSFQIQASKLFLTPQNGYNDRSVALSFQTDNIIKKRAGFTLPRRKISAHPHLSFLPTHFSFVLPYKVS